MRGMSLAGENADTAPWFKSSYSSGSFGCVEVVLNSEQTWVRDSKNPLGAALHLHRNQWRSFLRSLHQE